MSTASSSNRSLVDHVARANAAWGTAPEWIVILAEACALSGQSAVAKRLDYSKTVVSLVLSNSYRGDLSRVEIMVRGVLMSETIMCPEIGEMTRDTCLDWQAKPHAVTSSLRAQMYRACRSGCPHSRICANQSSGETK